MRPKVRSPRQVYMTCKKVTKSEFNVNQILECLKPLQPVSLHSVQCGGYLLGFRTDPIDKLTDIQKQIISLRQLYDKNPLFGGELSNEEHEDPVENPQDETDDIQEAPVDRGDVLSFYLAEDPKVTRDRPIYSEELGVAIEPLPEGYTLEELWTIFPEK
ncbi:hypothetical protein X801_00375 [Opisthorchis viverrini]|uniref:BBSome complex member BBS5 PH domain-containing protein n=1 Tax=Opisthorchis viverrini TaxID=6198 RepID=A0A1S8XAH1_OPIVI|nr:hypothetical protein X801_00375 [Opisthorchis viverrini]